MFKNMFIKISSLGAILAISLSVSLLMSFGAAADTPAATEQTASADSGSAVDASEKRKKKRAKRVCKRVKVTGSNMKKRVCRTQAQIDAQSERDRDFVRSIQRPAGTTSN